MIEDGHIFYIYPVKQVKLPLFTANVHKMFSNFAKSLLQIGKMCDIIVDVKQIMLKNRSENKCSRESILTMLKQL